MDRGQINNGKVRTDFSLECGKGTVKVIVGRGGSGKTYFLKGLFDQWKDKWEGNTIWIKAPLRRGNGEPFLTAGRNDSEKISIYDEPWRELRSLEWEGSSSELSQLLLTLSEKGDLGKGTLLLIDQLEYAMEGKTLRRVMEALTLLVERYEVTVVATISTILGLRASTLLLPSPELYLLEGNGREERRVRNITGSDEEAYRCLLMDVEDLG